MDLRKAAKAFRASLVADLRSAHEKDVAMLQAKHDDNLANLQEQYETKMAVMEQGMNDPIAFMAKFFPDTPDRGTETEPAKKRGRSPETTAVPAIDDAGDDIHMPKRGRTSAVAVTDQGTDGPSGRKVRRSEAAIDDSSIASDKPSKEVSAQARGQRHVGLQFAAHLIANLCNPHLDTANHPLMQPLNAGKYPDYYRETKHPMDLGTMAVKLNTGKYNSAEEVKEDFELMIQNCNDYNPPRHPFRDCGNRLRRHFDGWWKGKDRWERQAMREAERESHLAEDESEEEDEKDEEGEKEEDVGYIRLELKPTGSPVIDGRNRQLFENRATQIRDMAVVRESSD